MVNYAVDTSVAVPLLLRSHPFHAEVMAWRKGRELALAGHASAETYSVLTRLDANVRLSPADAARAMARAFTRAPATFDGRLWNGLADRLASAGVIGGSVFDALVALSVVGSKLTLATRDIRAVGIYRALGIEFEVVS